LYNSSNNTIIYNSAIQSNNHSGIFLNESCNYNTITNNNLTSNTKNGIFLNDHCNYNTFSNNEIYNNDDSGIRLENSSSNNVNNCSIYYNDDYGVLIAGSNNDIENCSINYNGDNGLILFGDDNNNIVDNSILGNSNDGIYLSNSTSDLITRNEIASNTVYGVNLDVFTNNNQIYNNYFHDNTENAHDVSYSQNTWNITKTPGTNIVGGSYISGNYWDDYDEASEGADDGNGDGIADSSYTIYSSHKDYGALLDTISPIIVSHSVYPDIQALGGYTYISSTITDNTKIKNVYVNVIYPNGQLRNFSIVGNKTGDVYYCNEQFSPIGLYSYHIAAKDPRKWANSSTGSFTINEGTAPTITDNSPTSGSPGEYFIANATVTDDADNAADLTVKIQWSHGNNGGNYTMINVYGDFFISYMPLDSSTEQLTYYIYAADQWNNFRTTAEATVAVVDNKAPEIEIDAHGRVADDTPNQYKYKFSANITDDVSVSEVTIEYWYLENDHITVDMEHVSGNYYEKITYLDQIVEKIYCIIYASDEKGNVNNSKNPFIDTGGPYSGVIGEQVTFDASGCFDLDGSISTYSWDFGDGTKGNNITTTHTYTTNGNYTITLTITDNDGYSTSETTYAYVTYLTQTHTTQAIVDEIENEYGETLNFLFYCYDSDGDEIPDTFFDPNGLLEPVHSGFINISGDIVFLLSIGEDDRPEFIWNATKNEKHEISNITSTNITVTDINTESQTTIAIVGVSYNKGWIYLEISDPDLGDIGTIDGVISVSKDNSDINSDRIIRKTGKTFILDDPEVEYVLTYSYQPPTLDHAEFFPAYGETINEDNPTIIVTYTVPVTVISSIFYTLDSSGANVVWEKDITYDFETNDNKIFRYTPPATLQDGVYYFEIIVEDTNGNNMADDTLYQYEAYGTEETGISLNSIITIFGIIGIVGIAFYLLMLYKNIAFESFVYIKNKKIIPFFKPIVFGPLKFDLNDKKVAKAEFYVNGELKDTLTQAPFVWNWNERAFLKHTIEAKIYDEEGKSSSTGEMTFFIFNSPRFFK
jgi:parallel beta-helix repeat protein